MASNNISSIAIVEWLAPKAYLYEGVSRRFISTLLLILLTPHALVLTFGVLVFYSNTSDLLLFVICRFLHMEDT